MAKKKSNKSLWLMLALIVVIIAVILLLPSCGNRNAKKGAEAETESTTLVRAGETAPDFTVELTDGSQLSLNELRGKVVLLNFWATWCPPCRAELQRVQHDLIDRFAGEEFAFLPVSRGEDRATVAAFLADRGYGFTVGLDPEERAYGLFADNYIPRNFLIDRRGRIVRISIGYTPAEFDELTEAVEAELRK